MLGEQLRSIFLATWLADNAPPSTVGVHVVPQ
jgi:hypothetical protein